METTPLTKSCQLSGGFSPPSYTDNPRNDKGVCNEGFSHRRWCDETTKPGTPPETNGHRSESIGTTNEDKKTDDDDNTDDNNDGGDDQSLSFWKLPARSKYVLVLCCFAQTCSAIAFAVIAPFYPHEAEKKGLSATLVGLVFSVFELVNFTTSPFIGNFMTKIGTRFVFIAGIFLAGTSSILFGLLDHCPDGLTFFTMSLICRAFVALGFCAFTVANFAIVSSEFPSKVATVFGVLETMQGIGLMSGPLFGSALYELGGFCAPFYCLGTLVLISDVLIYFLLPNTRDDKNTSSVSMTSLARIPAVIVSLGNITVCALGIGFMESTLAKHLEDEFHLKVSLIGTMFIITPAIYGVTMPVWGYFVDKQNFTFSIVIVGLLGSFLGYLFIAPCPWPGILPSKVWIVIIGQVVLGLSYGPVFIGATKCLVTTALENGYLDNLETFGLVSGLFYSSYCFGMFTGPFLGGILTQNIGFPLAYTVLSLVHIPNAIVSTGFLINRRKKTKQKPETSPENETPVQVQGINHR